MKDPIVAEVRKHRMEHAKRFNFDLALICADLRKQEANLSSRFVPSQPRRIKPKSEPHTGR